MDLEQLRRNAAAARGEPATPAGGSFVGNPAYAPTTGDYIGGFLSSAGSGVLEVFGHDPLQGAEDFRARNPVAGIASDLVGFGAPFVGWEAAAAKVPRLIKAAEAVKEGLGGGVLGSAGREAMKLLPFELARAGVAVGVNDNSVGDALADSAFNLGIAGGAGAVGGIINRTSRIVNGLDRQVDPRNPIQLQLRSLINATTLPEYASDPVKLGALNSAITDLRQVVREWDGSYEALEPVAGQLIQNEPTRRFVRDLGDGFLTRAVNVMFRHGKKLTRTDMGNDSVWMDALKNSGIDPDTFPELVQLPRLYFGGTNKFGRLANKALLQRNVGNSTMVMREKGDGLYTVVKPVDVPRGGKLNEALGKELVPDAAPQTTKAFLVFKTDMPEKFAPMSSRWADEVDRLSGWEKELTEANASGEMYATAAKTLRSVGGLRGSLETTNAAVDAVLKGMEKYGVPGMFQLRGQALPRAALATMAMTFDAAKAQAQRMAFGIKELDPAKNALTQVMFGDFRTKGLSMKALLDAVDERGMGAQAAKIRNEQLDIKTVNQMYAAGEIDRSVWELFSGAQNFSDGIAQGEIHPLQQLTGIYKYRDLAGHYGFPRTRVGDYRGEVRDPQGNLLELVGDKSAANVDKVLNRIVADAALQGKTWTRGEVHLTDAQLANVLDKEYLNAARGARQEQYMARRLANKHLRDVRGSQTFKSRANVPGWEDGWDKDRWLEEWYQHADMKMNYAASLATSKAIGEVSDKIRVLNGSHALDIVARRLRDNMGIPGEIASATNAAFDKVLGPVIGKNSATAIAQALNKTVMHLSLGALNMAYPAMNMLTFLTNVVPAVSFVKHAPRELLNELYDVSVARARDGVQAVATPSTMKIMFAGAKQMVSKEPDWLEAVNRAATDSTLSPRFVEHEIGGSTNSLLNDWKGHLKSPVGWAKGLYSLSELVMASSERLARGQSFATGYKIAKDLLFRAKPGEDITRAGWRKEQIYQFAKRFTEHTNFRYATPDRPTMFAGPVGSVFGLFKNWSAHYFMTMLQYANMVAKNPKDLAAWKPLMYQTAALGATGGISAMPLFSLANNFSKWATNEPIMEHVYRTLGDPGSGDDTFADATYYGLPAMLGLSLSAQAQSPITNPLSDAAFMFTPVILDRMKSLYAAIGDSTARFDATGRFNPLESDKLQMEWARATMPRTIYKALQAQSEGLIRSSRDGEPLIRNIGTLERIGFAMGMTPVDVQRMYTVSEDLWQNQEARKRLVQTLGTEWAQAQGAGDYRAVNDVMRRAVQANVLSNVMHSAMTRVGRERSDMVEDQFSPLAVWERRASLPGGEPLQ